VDGALVIPSLHPEIAYVARSILRRLKRRAICVDIKVSVIVLIVLIRARATVNVPAVIASSKDLPQATLVQWKVTHYSGASPHDGTPAQHLKGIVEVRDAPLIAAARRTGSEISTEGESRVRRCGVWRERNPIS
jgi:hypothetical protein